MSSNRTKKKSEKRNEDVEIDELLDDDYWLSLNLVYVEDVRNHSIACMASELEARIIGARRTQIIKCEQCRNALIENELIDDTFIRFKSNNKMLQPCKSTFEICKFADLYLKTHTGITLSYTAVALEILSQISFTSLFVGTNFENHPNSSDQLFGHRYEFVKKIVQLYMQMKSIDVAKKFTLNLHDNPMRHTYRKLVQEKGQ